MSSSSSSSARGEAKPETNGQASARGTARDAAPLSARQQAQGLASARGATAADEAKLLPTARPDGPSITARVAAMDTSRDYMSTARMHTALAALTAERSELLNKLAFIDSTLEAEGKKKLMRTRGFMAPMGK